MFFARSLGRQLVPLLMKKCFCGCLRSLSCRSADSEDGGRLCVVDTHPLTVRTDNGTLFVRPWRTSEWRELDDPGADYGACD